MHQAVEIRPARPEDRHGVEALLSAAGLFLQGVDEHFAHFVVADNGGHLLGAAGLERHGDEGLLRSVIVAPDARGLGLGEKLTEAIVASANRLGLISLSLLTRTAEAFFARLGFERVPLGELPPTLSGSRELCCPRSSSAVAMTMLLNPLGRSAIVFRAAVHGAWRAIPKPSRQDLFRQMEAFAALETSSPLQAFVSGDYQVEVERKDGQGLVLVSSVRGPAD